MRVEDQLRQVVRQHVSKYEQFAVELDTLRSQRFVQQMPHGMVGRRFHDLSISSFLDFFFSFSSIIEEKDLINISFS